MPAPAVPSKLVNNSGNPWVKFTDPYPYPCIPLPVNKGMGIGGIRVKGTTGITGQKTCEGVLNRTYVATYY